MSALPAFLSASGPAVRLRSPVVLDEDGAPLWPTSASSTVSIYDSDGAIRVSAAATTLDVVGRYTRTVAAADLGTLSLPEERPWRIAWSIPAGGQTHVLEEEAWVCRRIPRCSVTEEDLLVRQPSWRSQRPAGSVSLAPQILAAWQGVLRQAHARKLLIQHVLDDWKLHEITLASAIAICAGGLEDGSAGTRWGDVRRDALAEAQRLWDGLSVAISPTDALDGTSTEQSAGEVIFFGVPRGVSW
jgi:hypothetical protein